MSLRQKILFSYIILIMLIGSMTAILLFDRARIREIEEESAEIRSVRRDINTVHRRITELATLGESVMAWDTTEYHLYHEKRMSVDTLLADLKQNCTGFVLPEQVDTLRMLLSDKEHHLYRIMKAFHCQEIADSLIAEQLPKVTSQATRTRTVIRKKKGIAGWFGKKDTVTIPVPAAPLHSLNERLISLQEKRIRDLDTYTDSLRFYNRELNIRLYSFIAMLDRQAQTAFQYREQKIAEAQRHSFRLIAGLVGAAIVLLIVSHIKIMRDIQCRERDSKQKEELISKLRKINGKNEELIKSRRKIIQTITHELRSPLAAISGNAELLTQDIADTERQRHTEAILLSSDRMTALLNNLLNFFRLDSGKETVSPRPFRLAGIVETLDAEFRPQAEAKGLAFVSENCIDEVVLGDKDMVLRIGSNLLSNAVKFTERGMVSIRASFDHGIYTMEVEDTGSGIDKRHQKIIYRPFERLSNAATQDGFGLGLSIVRNLVRLMNGKIFLDSESGEGCTFTIKLPLDTAGSISENLDNRTVSCGNITVLLLDNDEVILAMTKEMLVRQKIHCDICRNLRELLDCMRTRDYDLLITDLKMPDINGYEILELLRTSNIGNSREIPVIACTAMDNSSEAELLAAGFSACLFKPFSGDEAARIISSCIGNTRPAHDSIDLTPLIAYGNKEETLDRLASETVKEMDKIWQACRKMDIAGLDTMIHHLRSSWMLLNAARPLQDLYDTVHSPEMDGTELKEKVQAVLDTGEMIVMQAQKKKEELWEK